MCAFRSIARPGSGRTKNSFYDQDQGRDWVQDLVQDQDLAQGLEVYCLSADNHTGKGSVDMGYVLNPTEHESGTQYIHSIGLPIETLGAPIVFEDKVIGINSGWLIDGFENYKEWLD